MTLGEFFDMLSANPSIILCYFFIIPFIAFLSLIFGKGEGEESPWTYLYAILIHLVVIPGIFAVTLNVYLFLFERMKILDTNLFTQVLPIISMIFTLALISKNTRFDVIPGFGRLSALIAILIAIISFMWLLDRTHIIAITFIPFHYIFLFFIAFLVVIRFAGKRLFTGDAN